MQSFWNFCEDKIVVFAENEVIVIPTTLGTVFLPDEIETILQSHFASRAIDWSTIVDALHGNN